MRKSILVGVVLLLSVSAWAESAGVLLSRARKESNPSARVELLTKALAKDSHLVNAYHYRGDAYLELGKTDFGIDIKQNAPQPQQGGCDRHTE